MTSPWNERLIAAIDADDEFSETDDAESGPWDLPAGSVRDQVIIAALIGQPTLDDVEQILAQPEALDRLRRHWTTHPPTAAFLEGATQSPALRRLLSATGHTRSDTTDPIEPVPDLGNQAAINSELPQAPSAPSHAESTSHPTPDIDHVEPSPSPIRLGSRRKSGFALAAAEMETRHSQDWPDGRLIRQRLADGKIVIAVDYNSPGGAGRVLRISTPTDAPRLFRLLLMLTPASEDPSGPTVAQVVVTNAAALDAVEIDGPVDPAGFTAEDLAVVPDSVAHARGDSDVAWRQAARSAGPQDPLHAAVIDGIRRR
jgi:hypothetical protein